MCRFSRLH